MKKTEGRPLPLGVTITDKKVNFSAAVPDGKKCSLLLYDAGTKEPCEKIDMTESMGEVRFLALEGLNPYRYEYNYLIDGKVVADPYVRALSGREDWKKEHDLQAHEVRGKIGLPEYNWEGDRPLHIPYHKVTAYSLHVRGFTRHSSSKVEHKGTFRGVIEKIPYLIELGINQIQCMPVYEFEECLQYTNYWGYGEAFCFAPKSAYASSGDGVTELKDMIKACHGAGIEVVLEMPFSNGVPGQMIGECLRYYMMDYHIDGFILNPCAAPMDSIYSDPLLKKTKIMKHDEGFRTVMRRFLKGDEGMVGDVIYWLRHNSAKEGTCNDITGHTGFTLNDLVSYDGKHNEMNGENNQDGPDYNYSWNCGAEGPSRKKAVVQLRKVQMKNAFFLLLLAQGTPCILAGDEFANTQKGNNNVYCQDNPVGWLDWSGLERNLWLYAFVKELIGLRRSQPVLHLPEELKGMDLISCGTPDVSYHGECAWQVPSEVSSRQLGVYYYGVYGGGDDCFIMYNMHWLAHTFALPALPKDKAWYRIASTEEGVLKDPVLLKGQRSIELPARTIIIMAGRKK